MVINIEQVIGSIVAGLIALATFAGRHVFDWHRTRIQLKKRPRITIYLRQETTGYLGGAPKPVLEIALTDVDIFTRQRDGQYWLSGEIVFGDGETKKLRIPKNPYTFFMGLGTVSFSERHLPDLHLYENDGLLAKNSRVTVMLFVNDRRCFLAKNRRPSDVKVEWDNAG